MVPGIEDLLPPPPKKGTKQVEGELLPPPPKKKMEDGTGTSGEIGGTVGASKAQSNIPVSKTTVTEEFTENLLDPATSIKKQKDANTVFTQSQVLGDIEIADEAIPANIIDKAGYRTSLQQRINSKIPEQIDLEVIATSTNKPIEAVEAYTKGRDGKGVMIEFDTVKKNKATELNNLITKANADLGLSDDFDAVFTSPETASLYLNKIQTAYNQKTEREFNSLNEVVINGKKRILEQDDEAYIDKSLPASKLRYYNPIKNRNDQVLNVLKSTIGEDILTKIENDENLTYDQKVKKAGDLVFGNELKNISEAEGKRFVKDSFGALNIVNQFGKLFRNEDEETKNLNSINAIVETKLNSEIQKEIVYKQAAMADILQLAMEKANAGTLTEEDKVTYQEMVTQLKDDIAAKQKDYKSPQVLQKEYPILLKQSVIADINNFNAIQSGNVVGYEEGGYKGISLKEHLKAQGYDMNSQVVKDAISDAESGLGVKDYSFFGEPIKAIKEVFTSSAKSLGNIIGVRDDVTVLSEKKAGELFPTTVGENDEMQLTTAASTAQNIFNTTGQVIGQGLMQVGTAGLGRLAGLSKVAAANTGFWSSGALTSYDAAYKDSFDFIDSNTGRTAYAGLIALSNAASEKIFPEAKLLTIPGVKSAFSELASKIGTDELTDKLANQLLSKAKNAFIDYGKKYASNIGKETLEETATSLFESGARLLFGDPNMDTEKAIENAKNTAIQTAIGTVLIGGMGAHKDVQQERNVAPSSVIYNAAVYKDEAMDALTIGFKEGNYDEVEYNNKVALLNTAEVGLSELKKAEQVIGRELTRPQKELFVANTTAQKVLIEQKKGVEDEAVLSAIDEKLKNLQSQQKQLLENKVQIDEFGDVIVPVKQTPKETITEEETKTELSEAAAIVNSLEGNKQVPAFEFKAMQDDPEGALRAIADQALGIGRVDGVRQPLSETANEPQLEATVRKYGQEVVDKAIAMFPAEKIEATKTVTEQTEVVPEIKEPTNKKERLAAFKNKYVAPTQPSATEQKQWNELSMQEKLALAKENLPEVDNLTNTEAVKVADQNAKMLLGKLNKQLVTEDVPPPTEVKGKDVAEIEKRRQAELESVSKESEGMSEEEMKKTAFQRIEKRVEINERYDKELSALEKEQSDKNVVVDEGVGKRSDADIEKRMLDIEDGKGGDMAEFNKLEKEMEKRERATVFDVPLEKVNDAVDALMKKEKEQPNGYGSFIERRDARETKEVADKYSNTKDISDADLKNDFKEALMGKPATWYADGLKLRESMKEASKRGIDIDTMLKEVEKEFTKDGFTIEDAKKVISGYLEPIFKKENVSEQTPPIQKSKPLDEGIVDKSTGFNEAGEKSKETKDATHIGRWLLDNAAEGDVIKTNDGGYEVTGVKTKKNGTKEVILTPFELLEDGTKDYNNSGIKLLSEQSIKNASDVFESIYTNSKGERITEKSVYEPKELSSNTPSKEQATKTVDEGVVDKTETNIDNENIKENEPVIADDSRENELAVNKLTEEDNIEQEPNVKAIEQQADNVERIGSKEIEQGVEQANELINAAIDVVNVPIAEIKTNETEYQGRKNKYSERSAKNVAENFDKNKLQPIVVYKHPDGNTYVLSGHSRLEGMKRRGASTIPATYFEGTPQEAKDFSLKSNKLGTLQTDIENAAYYRAKLLAGESYNALLKEAKENEQEGSAKRIVSLAHLNPNGKTMQALEALDKGEGDTKNNILNIATKIGDIRAKNEHLTNAHENELFEFMAADKKNIPTDKDLANSNNVLNRSLNQAKFTPEEPLNLDRAVNKSANRIEWERELRELEAQQAELKFAVNPSKKTGWTGLKEKAIATLAKGDNSKEGIDKAVARFENNENGIKDAYQRQLETKRGELAAVNDKLAKHLLREKDLIQGDKAQQSLFSIQSPTTQEISDMKDIVKDYVDEGTASLKEIQDDVAKELGDNSQEMRDLVEKAYNEFTKTTDFAPKEITGGVIGRVGKFLSRFFGGTAASKVFILKDTAALQAKAEQLGEDVKYQKSLKDYINIVFTSIALSATPAQTSTSKVVVPTEINEGQTKSQNFIKKLLTDYYSVNNETVPPEVMDRAMKVWERVGKPLIKSDSTKNDDRAFASIEDENLVVLGNITDFDDLVAELAHAAQYSSKAELDIKRYATQEEYDAAEYERVGSVEYDAHKFIESMIAAYIVNGKIPDPFTNIQYEQANSVISKYKLNEILYMKSPEGNILGFTHNNIVYLNAEHLNTNTPIHEAGGHIFLEWARTNNPEVYARGMQLTENSKYLKEVKANEFYKAEAFKLGSEGSKEYSDYMKHEALAMAIGDKGAQFVGETRKKDFKEWLNNLWDKIKAAAGFKDITATELQNLTFDEFTKRAAADILREQEAEPAQGQQQQQQQQGTGAAPAATAPRVKSKLSEAEVKVIYDVLNKPINEREFPAFFDMNQQGVQQTAKTQGEGQERKPLDGTYVQAHLADLRSISLSNARQLQDALGKDWKEKMVDFFEENPTAGNIAQVSGLLNVINTDINNEIARSKNGTEISKLKDLQARADRITYDTSRSASLALNQRRMYQDFGQGKDVVDILSAVILTPEQQDLKAKAEEALKQKFTDEELNKPKPVKPKKAAQPKAQKPPKPKSDDSVKKDLISKGKRAAQQTDADGNVTIVSLKDKIQQANDALNGFKC